MTVVPLFKSKKIWLPSGMDKDKVMVEIVNELSNASASGFKSKHDDFIDTVSMLSVMMPFKPTEEISYVKTKGLGRDIWADEEEDDGDYISSCIF